MSTETNKAIVRRFITEVLAAGNPAPIDELLAPNYVNRMLGQGLEAFKKMAGLTKEAIPDLQWTIESLVAEGDQVVARFLIRGTQTGSVMGNPPSGKALTVRGLTYYRLVNNKIVEDDPITTPDLAQALGVQMPPR